LCTGAPGLESGDLLFEDENFLGDSYHRGSRCRLEVGSASRKVGVRGSRRHRRARGGGLAYLTRKGTEFGRPLPDIMIERMC
jgi:hypothetical protein